jgi:hypothetical protein
MVVHPCSNCGRPRPVVLLPVQPPCPACGVAAPLTPELESAIDAARTAVLNLPLRAVQLRASDEKLVELEGQNHADRWRWAYIAFPLIIGALAGAVAWADNPWSDPDQRPYAALVVLVAPLLFHLGFGWLYRRRVLRDRETLRTSLQARPAQDGTFACRICGGPIANAAAGTPVVACPYCRAPNLLDPNAAVTAARDELVLFETLKERTLAAVRPTASAIVVRQLLLYTPLVLFVALITGYLALDRWLTAQFHRDPTVTAHAGVGRESEDGREVIRTCLVPLRLPEYPEIPLAPVVGTEVEDSGPYWKTHVIAEVGRDGWGRVWMRSTEGRWLWHDNVCWPPRDPHGERWKKTHPAP